MEIAMLSMPGNGVPPVAKPGRQEKTGENVRAKLLK